MSGAGGDWPVIVLSLPGDGPRRAPLMAALAAQGIVAEVFEGIDGRAGLPAALEPQIDRAGAALAMGRPLSDGEFACALSHLAIARAIVARGLPGAVVLEDDAIPGPRLAGFLAAGGPALADLVLLDHSHARVRRSGARPVMPGVVAHPLAVPAALATAYCLSRRGAEWLLARALPVRSVADWPADITEIGALALLPRLVDHPDPAAGPSHLRGQRDRGRKRAGRFLEAGFWRRWLRKRLSRRVS